MAGHRGAKELCLSAQVMSTVERLTREKEILSEAQKFLSAKVALASVLSSDEQRPPGPAQGYRP